MTLTVKVGFKLFHRDVAPVSGVCHVTVAPSLVFYVTPFKRTGEPVPDWVTPSAVMPAVKRHVDEYLSDRRGKFNVFFDPESSVESTVERE